MQHFQFQNYDDLIPIPLHCEKDFTVEDWLHYVQMHLAKAKPFAVDLKLKLVTEVFDFRMIELTFESYIIDCKWQFLNI